MAGASVATGSQQHPCSAVQTAGCSALGFSCTPLVPQPHGEQLHFGQTSTDLPKFGPHPVERSLPARWQKPMFDPDEEDELELDDEEEPELEDEEELDHEDQDELELEDDELGLEDDDELGLDDELALDEELGLEEDGLEEELGLEDEDGLELDEEGPRLDDELPEDPEDDELPLDIDYAPSSFSSSSLPSSRHQACSAQCAVTAYSMAQELTDAVNVSDRPMAEENSSPPQWARETASMSNMRRERLRRPMMHLPSTRKTGLAITGHARRRRAAHSYCAISLPQTGASVKQFSENRKLLR